MRRARKTSETAPEVHAPILPLTAGVTDMNSHVAIWCDKEQLVSILEAVSLCQAHLTTHLVLIFLTIPLGMAITLTQDMEKLKARDTRKKNPSVDLSLPTGIIPTLHTPHSKRVLGRT